MYVELSTQTDGHCGACLDWEAGTLDPPCINKQPCTLRGRKGRAETLSTFKAALQWLRGATEIVKCAGGGNIAKATLLPTT